MQACMRNLFFSRIRLGKKLVTSRPLQVSAAASYNVELLYDAKAGVAEGPVYDSSRHQLLWVDIEPGRTINFLDVEKRENRHLKLSDRVGAVIPVEGFDNKLLALLGRKICLVDRETGATNELTEVEQDKPTPNRLNDAKCDNFGRLWAGTMGIHEDVSPLLPHSALYSYTEGKLTKHLTDITVSNGIAWSPDNRTMYYIDSTPKKVYAFDFDESEATISNQRVLVDYSKDQSLGHPDGMCIDTEGRLWVAGYLGQHVICWEPSGGTMVMKVPIPAMRVTSCCFGGPDNDWLFVTTARHRTFERELVAYPDSGGIFLVKGLGAKGFPVHKFRYNHPAKV